MYRDAFQFDLESKGAVFSEPSVPDGKIKHDEFFGDVEIYRDSIAITLPLEYVNNSKPAAINIKTTGQGCADMGVCYPPLYQSLVMNLADNAKVSPKPYEFKPVQVASNSMSRGAEQLESVLSRATQSVNNTLSQATESVGNTLSPTTQPTSNTADETVSTSDNNSSGNPLAFLQALGDNIGLEDEDEIPDPDKAFQLAADYR